MSSYRQHLYHLVIRTKDGLPSINQEHVDQLYSYISGIIKNKNSHLYWINGVENQPPVSPGVIKIHSLRDLEISGGVGS